MTNRGIFFNILVLFLTVVLQSTLLNSITLIGVKPDLVLVLVILTSNYSGKIKGEIMGFSAGLAEDFLSLSPFGFNALIKTVVGYLGGATEGKIFLDPLVVPAVFVLIGTIIKAFLGFILLAFFYPEKTDIIFSVNLLVEMGMNILVTPFLYFFLKLIKIIPQSGNPRIL